MVLDLHIKKNNFFNLPERFLKLTLIFAEEVSFCSTQNLVFWIVNLFAVCKGSATCAILSWDPESSVRILNICESTECNVFFCAARHKKFHVISRAENVRAIISFVFVNCADGFKIISAWVFKVPLNVADVSR